jgi:hypothetical protein
VPSIVLAFDAINGKAMVYDSRQSAFSESRLLAVASPFMDIDGAINR